MKHTSFNHFKILLYEMGKIVFLNENGRCDMVLLYRRGSDRQHVYSDGTKVGPGGP